MYGCDTLASQQGHFSETNRKFLRDRISIDGRTPSARNSHSSLRSTCLRGLYVYLCTPIRGRGVGVDDDLAGLKKRLSEF
jgi:hypothetical protein